MQVDRNPMQLNYMRSKYMHQKFKYMHQKF